MMPSRQIALGWGVVALIAGVVYGDFPSTVRASSTAKASTVAQVGYIYHGLTVRPPNTHATKKGRVKMALFNQYFLRTQAQERASIRFKDGTTLNMNQRTDALLRNPHVTYVSHGEVYESLAPGTNHKVQTGTAVAAAVGTVFDVKLVHGGEYLTVVHGAVKVKGKVGPAVMVKTNQQSLIVTNHAAQPPVPVNAAQLTNWTRNMPRPQLGENVALDANGGTIADVSSQYQSSTQGNFWDAKYVIDGRLDTGWESASGSITNQWITIKLGGTKAQAITRVIIDPAATQHDPISADLKDFQIRVSTTGIKAADFHTVLTGTCQQSATLQAFGLPKPVQARYVQIYMLDNYGSPDWISLAEIEVVTPKHA